MPEFKVVWEIQLSADNPLEAAKKALGWLQDKDSICNQFYVQQEGFEDVIASVDLSEEDCDAVLPVTEYKPLISAL